MRLRNKKTGETHEITQAVFLSDDMNKKFAIHSQSDGHNYAYRTLAELNEEWEDYEEPKKYYVINPVDWVEVIGEIEYRNDSTDKINKEIGNYFETKEEAELAVRKLKAWKRLKDKGFRVIDYGDEDIRYEIKDRYDGCLFDLETVLFGGEE